MPIEREDFDALLDQLEQRMVARQEEACRKAAEQVRSEEHKIPAVTTEVEGIVLRPRGRRVVMVIVVMVTMVGVDHIFPIAAIMKGTELLVSVFFEYWFNAAKTGVFDPHFKKMMSRIPIKKIKDVAKEKTVEAATEATVDKEGP